MGETLAGSPPFVKRIRYAGASATRIDLGCNQLARRGCVFNFFVAEILGSVNATTGCVRGSSKRLRVSRRFLMGIATVRPRNRMVSNASPANAIAPITTYER